MSAIDCGMHPVTSDIQSHSDCVLQADNKSEPVSTVGALNKNYQSYQNRQPAGRKWKGNQKKQNLCRSKNHKKLQHNATEAEIASYATQKSQPVTESDKPASCFTWFKEFKQEFCCLFED